MHRRFWRSAPIAANPFQREQPRVLFVPVHRQERPSRHHRPHWRARWPTENARSAYVTTVVPRCFFLVIEPYNKNRFVRFHSFQSIFFHVAWIILWIALGIFGHLPFLGWASLLLWPLFVIWLILVFKAYQGKDVKLPVIGDMAEKQGQHRLSFKCHVGETNSPNADQSAPSPWATSQPVRVNPSAAPHIRARFRSPPPALLFREHDAPAPESAPRWPAAVAMKSKEARLYPVSQALPAFEQWPGGSYLVENKRHVKP